MRVQRDVDAQRLPGQLGPAQLGDQPLRLGRGPARARRGWRGDRRAARSRCVRRTRSAISSARSLARPYGEIGDRLGVLGERGPARPGVHPTGGGGEEEPAPGPVAGLPPAPGSPRGRRARCRARPGCCRRRRRRRTSRPPSRWPGARRPPRSSASTAAVVVPPRDRAWCGPRGPSASSRRHTALPSSPPAPTTQADGAPAASGARAQERVARPRGPSAGSWVIR